MSSTPQIGLPLVQPSQAQKHVTVNEALVLIDGLLHLQLQSTTLTTPVVPVVDGACYFVPPNATDAWTGHEGSVAIGSAGGWVFAAPRPGWRCWVADLGREQRFDGTAWVDVTLSGSSSGASARMQTIEFDYDVVAGGAQDTGLSITAPSLLYAVSARVLEDITGTASSWRLGSPGATDRFGSSLGMASGSYANGLLGQPTAYYTSEVIRIEPEGGDFAGGRVRLALHVMTFDLPGL